VQRGQGGWPPTATYEKAEAPWFRPTAPISCYPFGFVSLSASLVTLARYVQHDTLAAFGADKVNLSADEVADYRAQGNRMRERLERHIDDHPDYALVKMLNSGSLAKATALSTASDMDLAVYVSAAAAPAGNEELIYWLRDRLREAYPQLDDDQFDPQDACVTMRFRTPSLIDVDVVPVLYDGADDNLGTLVLKDTGERVYTSITQHIEFVRSRNRDHPQDFRQVVRLLKWWRRERQKENTSFALSGFMTELICAHLADDGVNFGDYTGALAAFFTYVAKAELNERIFFTDNYAAGALPAATGAAVEIFDPVNADNNVAAALSAADRDTIVVAAVDANEAIADATYATTKARAVEDWQAVLGPAFNP
jgi:tRNA nucleotidyltransferase (CCA-adding enzyme)